MQEVAKPKKPEPTPHGHVHSAGKQEDFTSAGNELAGALGWRGEPSWVLRDIAVSDAAGYLTKVLHESFISGAKEEPAPDGAAAAEHLTVVDAAEVALITKALSGAHLAGRDAELTLHKATFSNLAAGARTV